MSRVTLQRRRSRPDVEPIDEPEEFIDEYLPAPRRRRRWWRLLLAVALLAGLAWLLPVIVAHTQLLGWVLDTAAADLQGKVTVKSASLAWLRPIRVRGVEVCDADGKSVLQAEQLESTKSLAELLWTLSSPGKFRLEKPKFDLVLRPDGSNVEDLLAKYLEPSDEPSQAVDFELTVVDGTGSVTDQATGRSWQIDELQATVSTSPRAAGTAVLLDASAAVAGAGQTGRFAAKASVQPLPAEGESTSCEGEGSLTTETFPLAMIEPLLARVVPRTQLAGRLTSNVQARWGAATSLRGEATADSLLLATPALGADKLQFERLRTAGGVSYQGGRLEITPSVIECDLGKVLASGMIELGDGSATTVAAALRQPCELTGQVDLARLAQMLPGTLRVRPQTTITSGQVQLALSSRPAPPGAAGQGMVWQGRLEASNLTAVDRGRQFAWPQPVLITLAAHETPQGPVVDELKCVSDFLKIHAAGTPDDLAASASFDLKQLVDQLGQFVDFGAVQLAGDGWGHVDWKRSEGRQFTADVELQMRDLQLAMADGRQWQEGNVVLLLSAAGRTDGGVDTQLDAASLNAQLGEDRIQAKLTQPVLDLRGGGHWPLELKAQGKLQAWPERLQSWVALRGWTVAGDYDLTAQAAGSPDGVTIRTATLNVSALKLAGGGLRVDEPNVQIAMVGGWDRKQGRVHLEPATLTAGRVSLEARNVVLAMPAEGPFEISGDLTYSADLGQLSQWFVDPAQPPTWRMAGQLAGAAQLTQTAGVTGGRVDAEATELLVSSTSGERYREPKVRLAARGQYEHAAGLLRLEQLLLSSGTLGADAQGQIVHAQQQTDVQLDGQIHYDLEQLAALLRSYLGPEVRIVGQGHSPITYRGPLSLAAARASAAMRWQRAEMYGFEIGPGELKAALADGVVQAEPLELAVSQGQVRLAPRVRLTEPMELTLPPGPLAQQVQISPQMCDRWLKYVAPVLAGVTAAQGAFSVELENCRVPLADPAQSDLEGRFIIHTVEIGPGPLVREFAVLLGRESPAKLKRESVVPFQMVDGRVYHEGLELVFPDVTIRTHGSVGLDQTLAVMAEMPVPPKWLKDAQVAAALGNQTIRVPIGGTLSRPKLDERALADLSRKFLENAARNLLDDQLHRGLERLLGPTPR